MDISLVPQLGLGVELVLSSLYLCVCEEEDGILALDAGHVVDLFKVLVETLIIVPPHQLNLEAVVAAHVCRHSRQTLFASSPHSNKQGIPSGLAHHASYPGGRGGRKWIVRVDSSLGYRTDFGFTLSFTRTLSLLI